MKRGKSLKNLKNNFGFKLYSYVLLIIVVTGVFGGSLFLSSSITGNVIAEMNSFTANLIGGFLFIIGLIGMFFYIKTQKYFD